MRPRAQVHSDRSYRHRVSHVPRYVFLPTTASSAGLSMVAGLFLATVASQPSPPQLSPVTTEPMPSGPARPDVLPGPMSAFTRVNSLEDGKHLPPLPAVLSECTIDAWPRPIHFSELLQQRCATLFREQSAFPAVCPSDEHWESSQQQ